MTTRTASYALIAATMNGVPAMADMQVALDTCLDTSLNIPARAAEFEAIGWEESASRPEATDVFRTAAILGNLSATDSSSWEATADWASALAKDFGSRIKTGEAKLLTGSGAAIILQRNGVGLQTCLYVGQDPDLAAVAALLDGSILRKIGDVTRIRGDGPKSTISAHHLSRPAANSFSIPLSYTATFTLVLDRQPGDLQ